MKKLCIHLYEKIESGVAQKDLLENKLDVSSLFKEDMDELSPAETTCLKLIAQRAPADWFEVVDISGPTTLESLINKRFVIRSGDRLNIYWDIFREYILTSTVPIIALRYLPSTEFSSVYKVAKHLGHNEKLSVQELVDKTKLSEGTVQNIGTDLINLGVAVREAGYYSLSTDVERCDENTVLTLIRDKFNRHALTLALKEKAAVVTIVSLIDMLRHIYPNNNYADKTWRTYTVRLCRWLELCGFIMQSGNGWLYRDLGGVVYDASDTNRRRQKNGVFTAPSSPEIVLQTLDWFMEKGSLLTSESKPKGYRNALTVLNRFELVSIVGEEYFPNTEKLGKYSNYEEALLSAASAESTLLETLRVISRNPEVTGVEIGSYIAEKYNMTWTQSSMLRNGSSIKKWAFWINGIRSQSYARETQHK